MFVGSQTVGVLPPGGAWKLLKRWEKPETPRRPHQETDKRGQGGKEMDNKQEFIHQTVYGSKFPASSFITQSSFSYRCSRRFTCLHGYARGGQWLSIRVNMICLPQKRTIAARGSPRARKVQYRDLLWRIPHECRPILWMNPDKVMTGNGSCPNLDTLCLYDDRRHRNFHRFENTTTGASSLDHVGTRYAALHQPDGTLRVLGEQHGSREDEALQG